MADDWQGFTGHAANPHPVPELRLEDRPGYPFKVRIFPTSKAPDIRAQVKIGWLFETMKGYGISR